MTYNYGKQIRVCSKVSYILKENNDAGDLSPSPRIGKIIDSFTASHEVEGRAHRFTRDSAGTRKRTCVSGPYTTVACIKLSHLHTVLTQQAQNQIHCTTYIILQ